MTANDRKNRERQRKRDAGLVQLQIWVPRHHHAAIKAFAQSLAADPPTCHAPAGRADRAGEVDPVAGSTGPVAGKVPLAGIVGPVAGMEWLNPDAEETLLRDADNTAWEPAPGGG